MSTNKTPFTDPQSFILDCMQTAQSMWAPFYDQESTEEKPASPDMAGHADQTTFLKQLSQWHQKETQRFLNIPQLGLTRFYQENVNQATDRYNQFQSSLGEFFYLLYVPMEKACSQVQNEMAQMSKEQALPDDAKFYYDKWIKHMEKLYQEMYQSAEYKQTLAKTVDSMNAYVQSKKTVLEDLLKTLPIPNNTDMDALYKDLYLMKKRIKAMEKKLASLADEPI